MTVRALLIVSTALLMMMLVGCGKSKETYEKSFKESFQASFAKSCTESASNGPNALKHDVAKSTCECMATYLVNKFNSTELTKLSLGNSPEAAKIMDEAINSCK